MKKILSVLLVLTSITFAQTVKEDSTDTAMPSDSIDIKEIVRKQIEAAKEKPSVAAAEIIPIQAAKLGVPVEAQTTVNENKISVVIKNMPMHIKLFFVLSMVILLVLIFRRSFILMGKKTTQSLKEKIAMIREERVSTKTDPRLKASREQLMNSKIIYDATEKEISKAAKELKIAKGEFLLAARLKLFEVGKV